MCSSAAPPWHLGHGQHGWMTLTRRHALECVCRRLGRRCPVTPPTDAARPVQVLRGIAARVSTYVYHLPRAWTQALTLQTVCMCAPHVASNCCTNEPAGGTRETLAVHWALQGGAQDPSWSMLEGSLAGSRWRSLMLTARCASAVPISCIGKSPKRTRGPSVRDPHPLRSNS